MMKFRCLPAESQALMNESAKQNVLAKNRNLTAAEAEMDMIKPVTPYVAFSTVIVASDENANAS